VEQRAIFVLHHYAGWSQVELARNLELPVGTVKSRLHYATQTLRAAIAADARTTDSVESIA
jgi:RNA polymerase sigma-70 factor, ECF subfamily